MTSTSELLEGYERKVLAKQEIDSVLGRLRRVGGVSLSDSTYACLPDSAITAGDLRALVGDYAMLVEELARASNHLYDEISDLGEDLEARRAKP